MNICVLTDHVFLYKTFREIIKEAFYTNIHFDFFFSFTNMDFAKKCESNSIRPICLAEQDESFFSAYDLFFSLHCNQIFPPQLVENHICINLHPGYNPYNRGWFPHVFSMLNGLPIGVTIHRMDTELDHGPILYQEIITVDAIDTSHDVYIKLQNLEVSMLEKYLPAIVRGNYTERPMKTAGNINYKKDFQRICEIDLERPATYGEVIAYLRAMTFPGFQNAFFRDDQGTKIYITIQLHLENSQGL